MSLLRAQELWESTLKHQQRLSVRGTGNQGKESQNPAVGGPKSLQSSGDCSQANGTSQPTARGVPGAGPPGSVQGRGSWLRHRGGPPGPGADEGARGGQEGTLSRGECLNLGQQTEAGRENEPLGSPTRRGPHGQWHHRMAELKPTLGPLLGRAAQWSPDLPLGSTHFIPDLRHHPAQPPHVGDVRFPSPICQSLSPSFQVSARDTCSARPSLTPLADMLGPLLWNSCGVLGLPAPCGQGLCLSCVYHSV